MKIVYSPFLSHKAHLKELDAVGRDLQPEWLGKTACCFSISGDKQRRRRNFRGVLIHQHDIVVIHSKYCHEVGMLFWPSSEPVFGGQEALYIKARLVGYFPWQVSHMGHGNML
jgi:hypothetical protein